MAQYLFHKDIVIPKEVSKMIPAAAASIKTVHPTYHIFNQAKVYKKPVGGYRHNYDPKKVMHIANTLKDRKYDIFEVGVDVHEPTGKSVISKLVFRTKYNNEDDVSIPISFYKPKYGLKCARGKKELSCPIEKYFLNKTSNAAKTAWLNRTFDTHTTLNKTKYDTKFGGKE